MNGAENSSIPQPESNFSHDLKGLYDEPEYGIDSLTRYFSMRDNGRLSRLEYYRKLPPAEQVEIDREKDRIEELRAAFYDQQGKADLMEELRRSRSGWRTEVAKNTLEYIRELSEKRERFEKSKSRHGKNGEERLRAYDNELRILTSLQKNPPSEPVEDKRMPALQTQESGSLDKLDYGLNAYIMHFDKGGGGHHHDHKSKHVVGKFPDQKIPLHLLLSDLDNTNPLKEKLKPGILRYIHLPINNMAWIEKVLAIYYEENIDDLNPSKAPHEKGPAERLLDREYWKGQMHGGEENPVHARHMRPRFLSVALHAAPLTSSKPASPTKESSKITQPEATRVNRQPLPPLNTAGQLMPTHNFTLFMPFLHWETNGRRARMAKIISDATKREAGTNETVFRSPSKIKREERKADRKETLRQELYKHVKKNRLLKRYPGLAPSRSESLGPYLMNVAKVADEMDCDADERMLRDLWNHDSPLHMRRTLDQSYFWTMDDTSKRDCDQVVYRGTRAGRKEAVKKGNFWNTRVVMVDQLWMWILDEHTIVTSYPRRWGRNRPDPSGVHKSLRERMKHISKGQINSVFDLALITIDQCSRVFFDRTRSTDQRPEVMDIFANSIAYVTGMKTTAFDNFWGQMKTDSLRPTTQATLLSSSRVYLNINPEGTLLREAQDIAEELRMMSRIFVQQSQVVKDFKKALEKLNEDEESSEDDSRDRRRKRSYKRVPKSTIISANQHFEQIIERRTEIQELEEAIKRTCQELQELLTLKQQQASIIEARMALKRADLSINQGRTIMLFTVVTIFFLPLSFSASVFGMNNAQFGSNSMSIQRQLVFMFPTSIAFFILSLLVAFNDATRKFLTTIMNSVPWAFHISRKTVVKKVDKKKEARKDKKQDEEASIEGKGEDNGFSTSRASQDSVGVTGRNKGKMAATEVPE